jgi:hypothetical protein
MMIMIVQKAIGVTDPVVMCIHVLKEVQEKEAVVIGLLFKHNAPYESTSPKFNVPKVHCNRHSY